MSVSINTQYRIPDGGRDAFLSAVRETFKWFESLGGRPLLRATQSGGELTGINATTVQFPNAVARGAWLDAVTKPENAGKNTLVELLRAGGVTLVSRVWLNETPPSETLPTISQVLSAGRFRITPGRLAEGEAALNEAKSLRQAMGVESHTYTVTNGGPTNAGVRTLGTPAASFKELAEITERIAAQTEGRGPIPMAIESGALVSLGISVSTLVAL